MEQAASFVISLAFGVAIWALSPLVTGSAEPWDANSGYYVVALIIAGLIAGVLFPRKLWPVLVGLVTGQFIYMLLFIPTGPLIGVGVLVLFIYGLFAVAAALGGSRLRRVWQVPGDEPGNGE